VNNKQVNNGGLPTLLLLWRHMVTWTMALNVNQPRLLPSVHLLNKVRL